MLLHSYTYIIRGVRLLMHATTNQFLRPNMLINHSISTCKGFIFLKIRSSTLWNIYLNMWVTNPHGSVYKYTQHCQDFVHDYDRSESVFAWYLQNQIRANASHASMSYCLPLNVHNYPLHIVDKSITEIGCNVHDRVSLNNGIYLMP